MLPSSLSHYTLDMFTARVRKGGEQECWPWTGGTSKGYGIFQFGVGGVHLRVRAHRFAYALHGGLPLDGMMDVLHSCNNPLCCNPGHLRLGTQQDNMQQMVEDGRCRAGLHNLTKTHCPRGHAYGRENTYTDRHGRRSCKACARSGAHVEINAHVR